MATGYCRDCSSQVNTSAKFCPHCGVRSPTAGDPIAILSPPPDKSPRSPIVRFAIRGALSIILLYVIVAAIKGQIDDGKERFLKSENITPTFYEAQVKAFGSYENYKMATSKGMTAQQFAQYTSQKAACAGDWRKCSDNEQMVNQWSGWTKVQVACENAANDKAKYGDPEWSWLPFSTFQKGKDYVETGNAIAIEKDAKFPNQFNAKVRVQVMCFYNLKSEHVDEVQITER
jgi:hypothetical protein